MFKLVILLAWSVVSIIFSFKLLIKTEDYNELLLNPGDTNINQRYEEFNSCVGDDHMSQVISEVFKKEFSPVKE